MNTLKTGRTNATVELDRSEMAILNNALNEVCNGLSLHEFATRMGAERDEVLRLLEEISDLIKRMESIDAA